jgi:methyl-accepting chemotaxis protein
VQGGSKLADAASARVHEIVAGVRRVNATLGTIHRQHREQSEGIGHINESVATLDRMTQQNAALVEQSAAAATSLQGQAARWSARCAVPARCAERPTSAVTVSSRCIPQLTSSCRARSG